MANLSDAFGDIVVEKVGQEFIDYLQSVQGDDSKAYYKLIETDTLNDAKVDDNGDLSIKFSTCGRWEYKNNLNGYLKAEWFDGNEQYQKLIEAIVSKGGMIDVTYSDSDDAMDWKGSGNFTVEVVDGAISFSDSFEYDQE